MSLGSFIRSGDLWRRRVADLADGLGPLYVGSSTGTPNNYVLTIQFMKPPSLVDGERFTFLPNFTNTSSATAIVTGMAAAKNIYKADGLTAAAAGDLTVNLPATIQWDAVNDVWRLVQSAAPGFLGLVSDVAYAGSWDGVTTIAPSKNAVYDKIETVISGANALVSDVAYNAGTWDAVTTIAPSKNAVRDKIEAVVTAANALVDDTAYNATSWNGVTTIAPSKNAVRDQIEAMAVGAAVSGWTPTVTGNGGAVISAVSVATANYARRGAYIDIILSVNFTIATAAPSVLTISAPVTGVADGAGSAFPATSLDSGSGAFVGAKYAYDGTNLVLTKLTGTTFPIGAGTHVNINSKYRAV